MKYVGIIRARYASSRLKGYTKFTNLPAEEKFALYHPKNIGRQEKQNAFYDTI